MKIKQQPPLILASNSKIRQKILSNLGLDFQVIKPEFDEEKAKEGIKHLKIEEQALFLARNKALSISKKYPHCLVIASDQICQLGEEIISKSNNKNEAIRQLEKLNGQIHYQNNAVCLYQGENELLSHFERAKLQMKNLTKSEIASYVSTDQSWGSAGSYRFESLGKNLFTKIDGNQNCILGMATQEIINFLHRKK